MHKITNKVLKTFPLEGMKQFLQHRFFGDSNRLLLSNKNYEEISKKRSSHIYDAYKGETAYILSCGPSMEKVWNDELRNFLSDKLIISIKQTHDLAPENTDIHLYNEVRMKDYHYPSDTLRISCSKFMPEYPSHIHYPIREYNWENAVMVTNEYDKWSLEKSFERPWGVGIMFELGLFLPVHLGCKRVILMGFDMNDRGKYHFYDEAGECDSKFYNVDKEEFQYAKSSVPHYLKWAEARGLEVKLYSPFSELPIGKIYDIYSLV